MFCAARVSPRVATPPNRQTMPLFADGSLVVGKQNRLHRNPQFDQLLFICGRPFRPAPPGNAEVQHGEPVQQSMELLRAERFQAAWRSKNVPPVRQCPA